MTKEQLRLIVDLMNRESLELSPLEYLQYAVCNRLSLANEIMGEMMGNLTVNRVP